MTYDLAEVIRIYQGSDGDATAALYQHLEATLGLTGKVAVNLFRACKNSERAKEYRGGQNRRAAYDTKGFALRELNQALGWLGLTDDRLTWGWGVDGKQERNRFVLYVDLPTGQVSFHSPVRGDGPDYRGAWDGREGQAADRILRWIGRLLKQGAPA